MMCAMPGDKKNDKLRHCGEVVVIAGQRTFGAARNSTSER